MAIKKNEVSYLNQIASAYKLVEFDANKYTIAHLYGRKIADRLEYSRTASSRRGVGSWLGDKYAMLLSNVVVNHAIHIFGYDPQRPDEFNERNGFQRIN